MVLSGVILRVITIFMGDLITHLELPMNLQVGLWGFRA